MRRRYKSGSYANNLFFCVCPISACTLYAWRKLASLGSKLKDVNFTARNLPTTPFVSYWDKQRESVNIDPQLFYLQVWFKQHLPQNIKWGFFLLLSLRFSTNIVSRNFLFFLIVPSTHRNSKHAERGATLGCVIWALGISGDGLDCS